jgi:hypothetical protein
VPTTQTASAVACQISQRCIAWTRSSLLFRAKFLAFARELFQRSASIGGSGVQEHSGIIDPVKYLGASMSRQHRRPRQVLEARIFGEYEIFVTHGGKTKPTWAPLMKAMQPLATALR